MVKYSYKVEIMKKFTESISDQNLFGDESLLKDILVDFEDIGMKYEIHYNLQKYNGDDLMSVKSSGWMPGSLNNCWSTKTGKIKGSFSGHERHVKCYIIQFDDYAYEIFVSDAQRIGSKYGTPTKKLYDFFDILKDVQYRIESMGNTLALCNNITNESSSGGFKIMILEGKHK